MSRAVHHLDLWVVDPVFAVGEWGWLLGELGWEVDVVGDDTGSWVHPDGTLLFLGRSADQVDEPHDRTRAGLNHLALLTHDRVLLDRIRAESSGHGWHELYADRYPYADGEDHVALYLENSESFGVEIVWEAP